MKSMELYATPESRPDPVGFPGSLIIDQGVRLVSCPPSKRKGNKYTDYDKA